jgi:PGF-pre-PGF domain-containing protein
MKLRIYAHGWKRKPMKKSAFLLPLLIVGGFLASPVASNESINAATDMDWTTQVVDSVGDVGGFTSIAVDASGHPHISYHDYTNRDLKYARWTGSEWEIETVDSVGEVGVGTSIALDPAGLPHISYCDSRPNYDLKYARWTGTTWAIDTVDSEGFVGGRTSITLDSTGRPHIGYLDTTNDDLKYARWDGSAWAIETVDSETDVSKEISIALDANDHPHITYRDHTTNDLKYARWTGATWSIETVDQDCGFSLSMALDASDHPHIAYTDSTNSDLKYARWDGSSWSIETVDSDGSLGSYTSIALDASGHPHISYRDGSNRNLKYAHRTGNSWSIETVDNTGDVGKHTSIALDSAGNPNISYYDRTGGNLKYAKGARARATTTLTLSPLTFVLKPLDSVTLTATLTSEGAPLAGKTITWSVSDGSVNPENSTTDSQGRATMTYTAPRYEVEVTINASFAGDNGYRASSKGLTGAVEVRWIIQTVDVSDTGMWTSMALDASNIPHISYRHHGGALKYARWDGGAWAIETVDPGGMIGNKYASMALDPEGRPHIGYFDQAHGELKYARWDGSAWNVETVASDCGWHVSIAVDASGYPHMSYYYRWTDEDLGYARWTGSAWVIETVDSEGDVGKWTSIALDSNGRPHISYFDHTNYDLKYARWDGNTWNIETVDSNGSVGWWNSIALDASDHPHISYRDFTNKALKYARWDGNAWSTETVDSTGEVGSFNSIALDTQGRPHISYYDETNEDLMYARWDGSSWALEIVDYRAEVGQYNSIALDSTGRPHISYFEGYIKGLKYAKTKEATALTISPPTFALNPGDWTTLTATLTSNGAPLAGKTITWSVSEGSVDSEHGTTDSQGEVSVTYIAPDYETEVTINASFTGDATFEANIGSSQGTIQSIIAPAEFELSHLSITPSSVEPGEPVAISVTVSNVGETTGDRTVTLTVGGEAVDWRTVTLVPGASATVSFVVVRDEAGVYSVRVNGLTGDFVVVVAEEIETESPPASIENIQAGESAELAIENTSIIGLKITVKSPVENATVSVKQFTGKPSGVPSAPGISYQYLSIATENVGEDVENIILNFRVKKSWISEKDIDEGTIRLCRYDVFTREWVSLPTEKTGEKEGYLYFSAESPSLSMFVITGNRREAFPLGLVLGSIVVIMVIGAVFYWLRFGFRGRGRARKEASGSTPDR